MIAAARDAIVTVLRGKLVRHVSFLAAGAAMVQGSLLIATPFILSLYGASAFGLFATILALTSMISGLTSMRIDAVIPVIEARHRALRLVAAVILIIGLVTIAEYALIGVALACCEGPARWAKGVGGLYLVWVPVVAFTQTVVVACRAWTVRCQAFQRVVLGNLIRMSVFISLSIGLGHLLSRETIAVVNGVLIAQVSGDLAATTFYLLRSRRRERRLAVPWPLHRPIGEVRANLGMLGTTSISGILAIVNANIPVWTISYVFGLPTIGWFSAAQRIVSAPVQFTIDTVGVAFNQRARKKRVLGEPVSGDVLKVAAALLLMLAPVFAALGWLAHSELLGFLGRDWAGAGPTLSAMVLISIGSILYSAVEGLPMVFRLKRFLIGYHAARFVMTSVLAAIALLRVFDYSTWIYLFAICEMLLYAGNAVSILVYVRRAETAEAPGDPLRRSAPEPG